MTEEQNNNQLVQDWNSYSPVQKPNISSLRSFNIIKSGELDINNENPETRKKKSVLDIIWGSNYETVEPRHLLASDSLGEVSLIDLAKSKTTHVEKICSTWLYCQALDPFGSKVFVAGSLNSKIFVNRLAWNKEDKVKLTSTLIGHKGAIRTVNFLSESILLSGATDASVGLWDLNSPQKPLAMLQGHMSDILTSEVSKVDRNVFLTGSSDLTIKIWDIRLKNPQVYNFTGPQSSVTTVKFAPNSLSTFAAGSDDSFIRLFDLRMGKEIHRYQDPNSHNPIRSIEFSKSGRLIFGATSSHTLKVWDTQNPTGFVMNSIDIGGKSPLTKLTLSPTSQILATVDNNNNLQVLGGSADFINKEKLIAE